LKGEVEVGHEWRGCYLEHIPLEVHVGHLIYTEYLLLVHLLESEMPPFDFDEGNDAIGAMT
jgi:hypothetical protein